MKNPQELIKEVEDKYLPICEERIPSIIEKFENLLESKKLEFYLQKKIYIGNKIEIPNIENFDENEQLIIRDLMKWRLAHKLEKTGWKIEEIDGELYLTKFKYTYS